VIELILATRNAHKVHEIKTMLGPGFRVRSLKDYPEAPELIEDAETFAGNATRKATQLTDWLRTDALILADDSGLEVDALNGAPGVHSARFAASGADVGNAPDGANIEKLVHVLKNVPEGKRTARFRCVLALVTPGRAIDVFDGACEGKIAFQPSGKGGFGYDPLFIPNGCTQSFAELGEDVKNRISHRARALQKLSEHFTSLSQVRGGRVPPKA